jgi:hypothetical protein
MPEALTAKIARHLKDGSLDSDTIANGGREILGRMIALKEPYGKLNGPFVFTDFAGIPDFVVADYKFEIPSILPGMPDSWVTFKVYDYPLASRVRLTVTEAGQYVDTDSTLWLDKQAFASFTGPTYNAPDVDIKDLPNNGFYSDDVPEKVAFNKDPSGLRKGAFGLDQDGNVVILDEEQKCRISNDGFQGYRALIGGSNYIESCDDESQRLFEHTRAKAQLSYLVDYTLPDGMRRTSFILSGSVISLKTFRKVLENYVDYAGGVDYRAVELEYSHASGAVRSSIGGRIEKFGTGSFKDRRDHYTVRLSK